MTAENREFARRWMNEIWNGRRSLFPRTSINKRLHLRLHQGS